MNVTIGVSVTGPDARIVLLDATAPHEVIDEFELDVADGSLETLVTTLTSTDRSLTDTGHRLVATRICSSDAERANALRDALIDADLMDVSVVSQPDATAAVVRSLTPGETVASVATDGDTAALSIIDADTDTTALIAVEPILDGDRTAAYKTLLQRFSEEPGGATSVIVLGGASDVANWSTVISDGTPIPLRFPDEPEFALARGAAIAGSREQALNSDDAAYTGDAYTAPTVLAPQAPQLAYSEVDDAEDDAWAAADVPMQTPMRPLSAVDPEELESEEDAPAVRPKVLLLGSTVAAIVVVGFAALAVTVAINIRPQVTEQAIRLQNEAVPGKYFPVAPGQGINRDGENWTAIEKLPPPGVEPEARTFETKPLNLARGTAAPRVIEVYRDGTVGVQSASIAGPQVPSVGVASPGIPDFVPRLIPDFTKVNMCQVINFVGNMERIANRAVQDTVMPLVDVMNPVDGLSLRDVGVVAAVKPQTGALFDPAPVEQITKTAATGAATSTIPLEIFETDNPKAGLSQVLPPEATVLEDIPAAVSESGTPSTTSIFTSVIPDLNEVKTAPGEQITGITDVEIPTGIDTDTKLTGPEIDTGILSGVEPGNNAPLPGNKPGDRIFPDLGTTLPGLGGSKPESPMPDKVPGTDLLPSGPDITESVPELTPQPEFKAPDKPIFKKPDIPIFKKPEAPVVKPEPPVSLPEPPITLPEPPISIPEPKFSVPEPPVSIPEPAAPPKPIINLPLPKIELPLPKPAAPAAPVFEEPSAPPIPVLPELPKLSDLPLGGLFGSGS